jgi:hypothetical protein
VDAVSPEPALAIFWDVLRERAEQRRKWADCERLPDGTGGPARDIYERLAKMTCDLAYQQGRITHAHVFEEEAAEVLAATDEEALDQELTQVMAVCVKWKEDLAERRASRRGALLRDER